jgi:predicted RNA-binding Zn-ribbon protein involved in translation (DUF1610 family)
MKPEKEYIFYCNTCGKIESKNVHWITLQQNVDISTCPNCNVQIHKKRVNKGKTPSCGTGALKDTFDKYRGIFNDSCGN